ncbi:MULTISPECIES: tetratricopeptide repeat protein [unclassified Streptomyces]|uniref:serine/threonine-protein kinase n=3 Tax=Streptomyces TaxID=1883 RepID=UPI000A6FE44C|nr:MULTISPECIES: serine/threonine-protein kinase [unclassified Streptomyces]
MSSFEGPSGRLGDLDILEVRRGGMGEVLICRSREAGEADGAAIACKTFQRRFFFSPEVRVAYLREVRLWSRLAGVAHIMPVLGFQQVEDRPFVLMPAVLGGVSSLRDVIAQRCRDPWQAAFLAAQVALGMQLAGERVAGLVHGDLKPENVLLAGDVVFISDFGLARAADEAHVMAGTPAYRSPELRADPAAAGVASDIYAFGVLFWELLTGRLWQEGGPTAEPGPGPGPAALASLARTCLADEPAGRPASFAQIYLDILRTAGRHAPGLTTRIMDVTACVQLQLDAAAPSLSESRLQSLFGLQEYALTIEEADALPTHLVTPAVLACRGHALSLTGRDDEAIADFDRALQGAARPAVRLSCQNGKGLSLKRLGRYDEAIDLLRRTVAEQNEEAGRAAVLMNLATVYMERGDHDDALPLLLQASQLMPRSYEIWANLGQAYEGTGDYATAETVYRHAVQLAPHEMVPAMRLAAVCMDHLGSTAVAWAVLEQLGRQGQTSPEWAARLWACLLADGDNAEDAAAFATRVREAWPEAAEAITAEAHRLAAVLAATAGPPRGGSPPTGHPPALAAELSDSYRPLRDVLPPGFEVTEGRPGEPDPLSDPGIAEGYAAARDGRLFLGVRVHVDRGFYSFDFFGPPEHPDYLDRLAHSLTRLSAVMGTVGPSCRRRETPPFYHRCPACGVLVLTDRSPGVALRCRSCAVSAPTRPLHTPEFDGFVRTAAERLGRTVVEVSGVAQLFLAEVPDDRLAEPMTVLAARLGFEPVDMDTPAPQSLLAEVRSTRFPTFGNRRILAFGKTADAGVLTYVGGGTPDLEELEFTLRATTGLTASASAHYDPRGGSLMDMTFTGRHEDLLADLRAKAAADPHDRVLRWSLAWQCIAMGRLDEAAEAARLCVERWPEDAASWLAWAGAQREAGDPAGAIEAVRRSLALDPVQPRAFGLLAQCHADLGESEAARAALLQGLGLGGGI